MITFDVQINDDVFFEIDALSINDALTRVNDMINETIANYDLTIDEINVVRVERA